ncbi:Glycine--tRNA ligase [compost metagenome]
MTIDFDSLEDKSVTIRERDSMEQVRVKVEDVVPYLQERLRWPWAGQELGALFG